MFSTYLPDHEWQLTLCHAVSTLHTFSMVILWTLTPSCITWSYSASRPLGQRKLSVIWSCGASATQGLLKYWKDSQDFQNCPLYSGDQSKETDNQALISAIVFFWQWHSITTVSQSQTLATAIPNHLMTSYSGTPLNKPSQQWTPVCAPQSLVTPRYHNLIGSLCWQ